MSKNEPIRRILLPIVILISLFYLFQIIFMLLSKPLLFNNTALYFIQSQGLSSAPVLLGWIQLLFSQGVLFIALISILWIKTKSTAFLLKLNPKTTQLFAILLTLFSICFILFANQYYFPASVFSFWSQITAGLFHNTLSHHLIHSIMVISGAVLTATALLSIGGILLWLSRHLAIFFLCILGIAGLTGYLLHLHHEQTPNHDIPHSSKQSNVIIIALDGVKPEDLTEPQTTTSRMPTVSQFFKDSMVFTHSLTPSTGTLSAISSLLTGNNPQKTNVSFNLANPTNFTLGQTLPTILNHQGYFTVYASDDGVMNFLPTQYGFTKAIAPKVGFNRLLFSQINDFPLSNLLINFAVSEYLFPYNYKNRSDSTKYYPFSFTNALKQEIKQFPKDKPLFLTVNYTLPAYPYTDASLKMPHDNQALENNYHAMLPMTDNQIKQLLITLKNEGFLKNALILIVSTHGNAFGITANKMTNKTLDVKNSNGISSEVAEPRVPMLHLAEYHTLMGIQIISSGQNEFIGSKASLVSLIDIMPTILDFLKIQNTGAVEGMSLLPLITTSNEFSQTRTLFIESEPHLPRLFEKAAESKVVFNQGIPYYDVLCRSGMLIANEKYLPLILSDKKQTIISPPWMLTYYPQEGSMGQLVLVNLATQQWTTEMQSDIAKSAMINTLISQLNAYYGYDIALPEVATTDTPATIEENNITTP
jgi:arylsulfatase A-like enzyme